MTYRRISVDEVGNMVKSNIKIDGRNKEMDIDHIWVVPYAPFLNHKFDCQLNVELFISRVGGKKYMFKYIMKIEDKKPFKFSTKMRSTMR